MYAMKEKASPEVVKLLLEKNADPSATDEGPVSSVLLAHFCKLIQSALLAFTTYRVHLSTTRIVPTLCTLSRSTEIMCS
jgi:hypothetical protein